MNALTKNLVFFAAAAGTALAVTAIIAVSTATAEDAATDTVNRGDQTVDAAPVGSTNPQQPAGG
jgi:hypothetical protein